MYSWLLFINSKRTQRKTSKGNKVHEAGPRRPGTSSQGFLLMKSVPPVIYCDNTCEMSPRGAQGDTAPRVFTSGWSYRHICPYNSRLRERSRCSAQITLFIQTV